MNSLLLLLAIALTFAIINAQEQPTPTLPATPTDSAATPARFTPTLNDGEHEVFAEFEKFLQQFNKTYQNMDEFARKYETFKKNFLIRKQLADQERQETVNMLKGKVSSENLLESSFGLSPFMDLTREEFQRQYLNKGVAGLEAPETYDRYFPEDDTLDEGEYEFEDGIDSEDDDAEFDFDMNEEQGRFLQERRKIPKKWDWRKKGALNPIQNQGVCGGCWAFSTVSNIESQYFLKYKELPKFSEQQLVDCDGTNSGCSGGIMHNAMAYIQQSGIQLESTYPYQNYQGYCQYNPNFAVTGQLLAGYRFAGSDNENKIKKMLYKLGPLSITINSSLLQYYTGGVLNVPYEQCPYAPDHGVNLVGYGMTKSGVPYWIIRNTWGPQWGEKGYFRLRRGNGLCGVNKYIVTAVLN